MNYLTNVYRFIVKSYRVAKFLTVELWHLIQYVAKETAQGIITFYRYRNACIIIALSLAASWGAITDFGSYVAVRYNVPQIAWASQIKSTTINEVVVLEGRYEQILAEEEARLKPGYESKLKEEAQLNAKKRFDDEFLKAQLNFQ